MQRVVNVARERLAQGGLAIRMGARGVEIARVMKTAGYDFLLIDLEHGSSVTTGDTPFSGSIPGSRRGFCPSCGKVLLKA